MAMSEALARGATED